MVEQKKEPTHAQQEPIKNAKKLTKAQKGPFPSSDGWTPGWMDGWMDGWTHGWMEVWRHGPMDEWMDSINSLIN